jgi:hypothetical protein
LLFSGAAIEGAAMAETESLKGTDMKDTAKILAFIGMEIKTVRDLSCAQLALFHDIASGAVTPAESQLVQIVLSARLSEFEASLKASRAA